MADIALAWDSAVGAADLVVEANDLARSDGLEEAVLLSLFTDRRAADDDTPSDGTDDRRGWWADEFLDEGDRMGSRLWLMARAKRTPESRKRIEEYAREALAWMLEDRVAASVEAVAELLSSAEARARGLGWVSDGYMLTVTVRRPATDAPQSFRYGLNWDAQLGGA